MVEHAAASILLDHPDGLPVQELWSLIVQRIPLVETWYDQLTSGSTPAFVTFKFKSTGFVKAGIIVKSGGRWHLTSLGRAALKEHPDPEDFFRVGHEGYWYWHGNRERFEAASKRVEKIPDEAWISVDDLAAEVGLDADPLLGWLLGARPEGWRKVVDEHGNPPSMLRLNEDERGQWLDALADAGVDVSQGRADPSQRMPASDLRGPAGGDGDDETPRRAWLVRSIGAPGANPLWDVWLPEGVCSLPASRLRQLPAGVGREELHAAVAETYEHVRAPERERLVAEFYAFLTRMREGDIVVTNDGGDMFIGVVGGPPVFVGSVGHRADLQRRVDWNAEQPFDYTEKLPDGFSGLLGNPDAQIIELTEFLTELEELLDEPDEVVKTTVSLPDVGDALAGELLVGLDWLQECVELLRDRPQLIFYGPPGTGKTFLARELAKHLTGGRPENVQLVQFHPSYSYEDFFEGYRPRQGPGGTVVFEVVPGPFRKLVTAARAHPERPYVLIIDEINRGHLAKIFGELYFLLEYRGESVNLLYGSDDGQGFTLPRNVIVLGTMNTADRSIALVDTAMRRRFWFMELHPDVPPTRDVLRGWLAKKGLPDEPALLLDALNARIADREVRIGPTYLMRDGVETDAVLQRIWRNQILPLLEEHHYGEGVDVPGRYGLDALRRELP